MYISLQPPPASEFIFALKNALPPPHKKKKNATTSVYSISRASACSRSVGRKTPEIVARNSIGSPETLWGRVARSTGRNGVGASLYRVYAR